MDTLKEFRTKNAIRQAEWDPTSCLDLTFRGCELAGEVGEACNLVKKVERERRGIAGSRASLVHLAEELADVIICTDLIAADLGIDLGKAVREKFNATTRKMSLSTYMESAE